MRNAKATNQQKYYMDIYFIQIHIVYIHIQTIRGKGASETRTARHKTK